MIGQTIFLVRSEMVLRHLVVPVLIALPLAAQRAPLFKDEILPILETHCTKCHSPQQKMAGLDLTTFTAVMTGGSPGGRRSGPGRRT